MIVSWINRTHGYEKVKKTVKEKKIYEDILNSYQNSFQEINNLKDLYNLAFEEKNEDILEDCVIKINQLFVLKLYD